MCESIQDILNVCNQLYTTKAYNYKYEYYTKTPNGMRLDTVNNHKYGQSRDGYNMWSVIESLRSMGWTIDVNYEQDIAWIYDDTYWYSYCRARTFHL